MKPALTAIAAVLVLAVVAPSALAGVEVEGTGEPAYTNSAQNTQWIRWDGGPGIDGYKIEPRYYANNTLVANPKYDVGTSGTSWINWSGVATLQHGAQYGICTQGSYSLPNDSLFFPDGPNSCSNGTMVGKRSYTIIDRSKPTISVAAGGGGAATKSSIVSLHVDFTDDVAGPYPGNFVCVEPGTGATCAGIYAYSPECSVPNSTGKVNSFDCQIGIQGSSIPDGPVKFCTIAADAAIPDNPSSANQSASADRANLSAGTCDTILLTGRPRTPRSPRPPPRSPWGSWSASPAARPTPSPGSPEIASGASATGPPASPVTRPTTRSASPAPTRSSGGCPTRPATRRWRARSSR